MRTYADLPEVDDNIPGYERLWSFVKGATFWTEDGVWYTLTRTRNGDHLVDAKERVPSDQVLKYFEHMARVPV